MFQLAKRISLLVAVFCFTGCGPSDYEKSQVVNKELETAIHAMADAIATVEDEATAKVAAHDLDAAIDRYEQVLRKMKTLPRFSKADADKIVKEDMPPVMAAMDRLMEVRKGVWLKGKGDPGFKYVYERLLKLLPPY